MDLKAKITQALTRSLTAPYIRLEEENGISGFVVSPRFEGMSSLDRQELIEKLLSTRPHPLTAPERRQVLMIAGLTPAEFDAVGARIRVHKIRADGAGNVEILVYGRWPDAQYVRGALNNLKGINTTDPETPPGAAGTFMKFRASRKGAIPFTREEAARALSGDPYIEVMPGA